MGYIDLVVPHAPLIRGLNIFIIRIVGYIDLGVLHVPVIGEIIIFISRIVFILI